MTHAQLLNDLDAMSISTTTEAAALIRALQSKLDHWEAMAARDMRNGINREVETIHDRDVRAMLQVILATEWPQIDKAAESDDCDTGEQALALAMAVRSARRLADLMHVARTKG